MPYRWMLGLLLPLSVAACVTPSGLPCVTLAYPETRWENRSWGLHNVNRFEWSGIQAYREDGARAIQGEFRQWTHYIFPARTSKAGWLDLPDRTVSISHDRKTFLSQPRSSRTRVAQVMRSLGADCAAPGYSVKKGARIAGFETYELTFAGLTGTVRRICRTPALAV